MDSATWIAVISIFTAGLTIAIGSLVAYLIAYHTYGRWLSRKIFKLDPANQAPSIKFEDGSDYVPTSKGVVFGHHFTSIAGTGPIVGVQRPVLCLDVVHVGMS
jgi:carbon starvation protein CstA